MFEVKEALLDNPIKVEFMDDDLEEGDVVQFLFEKDRVFCVRSDGTRPFGIFSKYNDSLIAEIWFDNMIFKTDNYDHSTTYKIGSPLYSSMFGAVTSEQPFEDAAPCGYVLIPPKNSEDCLEASWI